MKATRLDATGKASTVNISDELFAVSPNPQLLHQAIRVYLANLRQGTSKVKSRGEVARTKRKWYRQKGTGNARHGAQSAPIFVGGGVAHGPKGVENWSLSLSTKMRRQALVLALSAQAAQVQIVEAVLELKGKTSEAKTIVDQLDASDKKVLVIMPEKRDLTWRSMRNLESVLLVTARQVTPLDVMTADVVVITGATIEALEKRLKGNKVVKE